MRKQSNENIIKKQPFFQLDRSVKEPVKAAKPKLVPVFDSILASFKDTCHKPYYVGTINEKN